jgi:hypothetical protein
MSSVWVRLWMPIMRYQLQCHKFGMSDSGYYKANKEKACTWISEAMPCVESNSTFGIVSNKRRRLHLGHARIFLCLFLCSCIELILECILHFEIHITYLNEINVSPHFTTFLVITLYLQSVLVHSKNCVKRKRTQWHVQVCSLALLCN